MDPAERWLTLACAGFIALLILFLYTIPVRAQHQHRPQDLEIHKRFYSTWTMPDNRSISCCHDEDCRPAEVRRLPNGDWEARQEGDEGSFTPVPSRKIEQDRDTPDGRNHLCGRRFGIGNDFYVYCFILGNGG